MIEIIDNAVQIAVLLACWLYALWRQFRTKARQWAPLVLFFSCMVLVSVFWLLYLAILGHTTRLFYVYYLGLYSAVLFLCICLQTEPEPDISRRHRWLPWLAPLFSAASFVLFIQWGDYLNNLIALLVMSWLGWLSVRALLRGGSGKAFAFACLLFYCLEYAVWICSCFFEGDSLSNPYFWFDAMQSVNYVWLLLSYRKAVAE